MYILAIEGDEFLTKEVINISHTKWVYMQLTREETETESSSMPFDAARKRNQKLFVRTLGTAVMVLGIAYMERLSYDSLWYRKESFMSGSSRDQTSIMINTIKGASGVSFILRMRYSVGICRKTQQKLHALFGEYLKITEPFNEQSVNTDTIGAENDAVTRR